MSSPSLEFRLTPVALTSTVYCRVIAVNEFNVVALRLTVGHAVKVSTVTPCFWFACFLYFHSYTLQVVSTNTNIEKKVSQKTWLAKVVVYDFLNQVGALCLRFWDSLSVVVKQATL